MLDHPKDVSVTPTGESIAQIEGGWPQCTSDENEANAALIVKAVNERDTLIAEIRRLRAENDATETAITNALGIGHSAGLQRAAEIAESFKVAAEVREHYTNDDADRGASNAAEKIMEAIRKEIK